MKPSTASRKALIRSSKLHGRMATAAKAQLTCSHPAPGPLRDHGPPAAFTEPRCHLARKLRTVLESSELSYFAITATLGYRITYRCPVHIQSDKNDIVH